MGLPIALYVPNILGYIRILLAFVGLNLSREEPTTAVLVWIFSASLDLIDGILARALDQCSALGVVLDIAADNILRTCVWIALVVVSQTSEQSNTGVWWLLLSTMIICLEWITMICTQLHSSQSDGTHWKEQRQHDPWLVKAVFAKNFTSPLGILTIYGLFSANLFAYGSYHSILYENIPLFEFWKYTAFAGRALSCVIEIWLCKGYLSLVIAKDMDQKASSKQS